MVLSDNEILHKHTNEETTTSYTTHLNLTNISLAAFKFLSLPLVVRSLMMMCLLFTQLLECVHLCVLTNLGCFQPLFL